MTIMDDADGSSSGEDHDDKAVHDKIWGIIAHNNYIDELSSLKFFVRLRQSIDHDETFQRVIKRTRTLLLRDDTDHLTFNEELDKIIENEKSLIYRSFTNTTTKEGKCSGDDAPSNSEGGEGGATSVWCLMLKELEEEDNLDVLETFKLYIIYYLNIKSDKVFKAILETLLLAIKDDGLNFEDALDFAINTNRFRISQAIRKVKRLDSSIITSRYQ